MFPVARPCRMIASRLLKAVASAVASALAWPWKGIALRFRENSSEALISAVAAALKSVQLLNWQPQPAASIAASFWLKVSAARRDWRTAALRSLPMIAPHHGFALR